MKSRPKKEKKKKRRKASGGRKGNLYERAMCVKLSKWYCGRDDGLWRTAGSGARATVRGRKGKQTSNHCGDICSTHPDTKSLTDLITFELKKGYNKYSIHDIIDGKKANEVWLQWVEKAKLSAKNAGTPYWAIIARRDCRRDVIAMPGILYGRLSKISTVEHPYISIYCGQLEMFVMRLDDFMIKITPKAIKQLAKKKGVA